jgi:hypothetical protein
MLYLPDFEKSPAPSSHLNNSMLSSVFISLNFATNFAGSEYRTRGSTECTGRDDKILISLNNKNVFSFTYQKRIVPSQESGMLTI